MFCVCSVSKLSCNRCLVCHTHTHWFKYRQIIHKQFGPQQHNIGTNKLKMKNAPPLSYDFSAQSSYRVFFFTVPPKKRLSIKKS